MSKVGKKSILIPDAVEVRLEESNLNIKGPKGSLDLKLPRDISVEIVDKAIGFRPKNETKQAMANWGTLRSLTCNAIAGVTDGFEKSLEIEGVGFRATIEGDNLVLNLGFSHPIRFHPPEGVKISVQKNTIALSGIDKELVGQTAAKIRAFKKPEPYKGKGIRYSGEVIKRKAGKKVAGTTK